MRAHAGGPAPLAAPLAVLLACGAGWGCAAAPPAPPYWPAPASGPPAALAAPLRLSRRAIPLPGAAGPMRLQALAADRELGRIWIPAGETGRVDVVDAASGAVTAIEGFPASPVPLLGQEARVGPSAVALGGGTAWIGNRGDGTICAFDARALRGRSCLKLPEAGLASSPAGLAWVAPTRELWVTLGAPAVGYRPADRSVAVLDAADPAALRLLARVEVGGAAEGHAVDASRGLFYTNLEDRNRTLAIDVRTRRVAATWDAGCGPEGPRGLAVDVSRNFLFVACADRVVALDAGRGGAVLGTAETGGGLDDIDYLEPRRLLFAASARTATLSVIRVGEDGALATVATGDTPPLARAVAADAEGRAWVADPAGGRILRFEAAAGAPELTSPASSAPSGGSTRRSGSGSDRW